MGLFVNRLSSIDYRRKGFTLIEIMVVISLFGIIASLISASYLTFERNQQVKNSAFQVKSDVRLIQNSAFSGNKGNSGSSGGFCGVDSILVGWYITIAKNASSYTITGRCYNVTLGETNFNSRVINFPPNITVSADGLKCGGSPYGLNGVAVLFKPLTYSVSFINPASPDFRTASPVCNSYFYIDVVSSQTSLQYRIIIIKTTGEVNEVKL